ncbi:hypothetical protein, partial [Mycolicibacterium vanbaalenii]|uniref:hypothetical protein n=1 Tax=Mycolicibacterium vanbaalenii TaxID=110539 RepID=UPI0021F315B4
MLEAEVEGSPAVLLPTLPGWLNQADASPRGAPNPDNVLNGSCEAYLSSNVDLRKSQSSCERRYMLAFTTFP